MQNNVLLWIKTKEVGVDLLCGNRYCCLLKSNVARHGYRECNEKLEIVTFESVFKTCKRYVIRDLISNAFQCHKL